VGCWLLKRSMLGAGREDVTETPTGWGVHEDVFCAGKEAVFDFLEGVLAEVIAIFPSRFLHIGGDEVILTPSRLSIPFKQIVCKHWVMPEGCRIYMAGLSTGATML